MIFTSIIVLLTFVMPSTDGMKPTDVNNHDVKDTGVNGIESITEITWNNIKSMNVKTRLQVKSQTQKLPISVYNELWKLWIATRQPMTRIASVALYWTPTSSKFNEMATLIVVDERFSDDGIKQGRKELLKTGKLNIDIIGSIITAVPFDPNFQQFIAGSLDFATDTNDINKIGFYITFPDTRMSATNSIAGFLDMSWKTMRDTNGVYEKVQWDVFTFPKQLPHEVAIQSGRSSFMKIKNYLDKKYNERKEELQQLEDFSHALLYGTDQGLNKINTQLNEDQSAAKKMIIDSEKRVEAIRLKRIQTELTDAKSKLAAALSGVDAEEISKAKDNLIMVFQKHNLEIPAEYNSDEGYIKIGDAQ